MPYTDYSGQATTGPYQGPGLATFTEPVSMNRAVISITSGFQATGGTPAITALQLSIGTLTNPTAYMLPVQVGYQLATGTACSGGVGTFVLTAPVLPANQTPTVVVSGAAASGVNGTYGPSQSLTWTSSTSFTATMTCATWTSGGMAGLQGLIAGGFSASALPQALSGSDTAYLWLTETNVNPSNLTTLTAGVVKVQMGGVQLQ